MNEKLIICIDDEKSILDSLKAQLKKAFDDKYAYEFAESADEALELIDELEEDEGEVLLVVSDWLMPGMKGDEFLINLHKKRPRIVKMLLTGQADESAVERIEQHGCLHKYLAKPWEEKELIDAITQGLKGDG